MIGVYYMYYSSAIVGHLIDLELGEGHEFKSHLELGIFLLSFFLSFLLSFILSQWLFKYFVFSALKRVHAQIVQYAMRWEQLTISWSDILFRTHAHQGLKKWLSWHHLYLALPNKSGCNFLVLLVLTLCFCNQCVWAD